MKKLLVLMLVLGMTSAASATLSLSLGTGNTVEIGGVLDSDMYLVISSDGMLSNYALTSLAPDLSGLFGTTADIGGLGAPAGYTGLAYALAASANPYPITGVVMTVDVAMLGDTVAIGWFNENMEDGIIATLQTPEPMTIALLGLGSLFMLRRRK